MTEWDDMHGAGDAPPARPAGEPASPTGARPEWLLCAAGGAVLGAMLSLAGGILLNLLGYTAASLGAFTLVALYRRQAVVRSAQLGVSPPRNLNLAGLALVALGFALSLVHSWLIASHFA